MLTRSPATATKVGATELTTALDRQAIAPLAGRLDGVDAEARAGMILATMAGYDLMMRVIGIEALRGGVGAQRRSSLAAALQHIVDGDTDRG